MTHRSGPADPHCAIAAALDVVGDAWTLLIVRDIARGVRRFDALQAELGVSRKVLAERLKALRADGVLTRKPYQQRPTRHEYLLTPRGRALLPVLVGLQDWGDGWVLGDGTTTATAAPGSQEAARVRALPGARLPQLRLASAAGPLDPVSAEQPFTVLYCFPGAYARPESYPPGWSGIPGAPGCTLESCTFRDRHAEFTAAGAAVRGVSTQRPDEQAEFAAKERLGFPLLSDDGLALSAALRLPTFRAGGAVRLKRLTLVLDADRTVRAALYPVTDIEQSVAAALRAVRDASR
jgi:DNA-binding HxlR family transcriptional regulator/peroxiredoxin